MTQTKPHKKASDEVPGKGSSKQHESDPPPVLGVAERQQSEQGAGMQGQKGRWERRVQTVLGLRSHGRSLKFTLTSESGRQ